MSGTWGRVYSKVVLLGDSLTQWSFSPGGWGARMADYFQRRADIFNRGFSGYNTEWMKQILPELLPTKGSTSDIFTLLFGANDSSLPDLNPQQHVPLSAYASNLAEMCSYLKSLGVPQTSIILITPPPLSDQLWERACKESSRPMDRSSTVVKQYAMAALQVGKDCGVTTLDLHSAMSACGDVRKFLSDGLHLTPEGNQFLADMLIPEVERLLEDLSVTSVYPAWGDVDWECPERTFNKV